MGIEGYLVYLDGSFYTFAIYTSINIANLSPSTIYTVSVEASDIANNVSDRASLNVTTLGDGSCTTTIAAFPYSQSFESGIGSWEQDETDDLDWTRDASGTPSSGTGPSTGADGSYYLYIEASSPNYPSKNAIIYTPCFDVSSLTQAELSFSYHMNGTAMGNLVVEASIDGGSSWSTLWSISGSQGDLWTEVSLDLPSSTGLNLS